MKRIGNLLNKITDLENIAKSTKKTTSTRKRHPQVASALKDLKTFCESVRDSFLKKDFDVGKIIERDIIEGTSMKPRHIAYLASFKKQVMMSVVFDLVGGKLSEKSYPFSYGSLPGKGSHHLAKHVKEWLRKDKRNMKYYLQCDIKHCFQSVRHDLAKSACRKFFKDAYVLEFFNHVIDSYGENGIGLPIGYLTSPWFAHFVLSPLDYAMSQKVSHYARYMDDIIMFSPNKRRLERAGNELRKRLGELGFDLHEEPKVKEFGKEPFDFVGIVYENNKITLRKPLMEKLENAVKEYDFNPSLKNARKLVSYNGWLNETENCKKSVPKNFNKTVESAKNLISAIAKIEAEESKKEKTEKERYERISEELEIIAEMENEENEFVQKFIFGNFQNYDFRYI